MKLFAVSALLLHAVLGSSQRKGWSIIHGPLHIVRTARPVKASDEVLALVRDYHYKIKVVESNVEEEGITPGQLKGFLVHLSEFHPKSAQVIVDRIVVAALSAEPRASCNIIQRSMPLRDYIEDIRSRLDEETGESNPALCKEGSAPGSSCLPEGSSELQRKAAEEAVPDAEMKQLMCEALLTAVKRIQAKEAPSPDDSPSEREAPKHPDEQVFTA